MTEPTKPTIAAGWLTDPQNPAMLRYWDGQAWTEHTAPGAPPVAAGPVGPRVAITTQPKQTSHVLHLILSILTCGVWAVLVWWPISIINRFSKDKAVTRYQ